MQSDAIVLFFFQRIEDYLFLLLGQTTDHYGRQVLNKIV